MIRTVTGLAALALATLPAVPAAAEDRGGWSVGAGAGVAVCPLCAGLGGMALDFRASYRVDPVAASVELMSIVNLDGGGFLTLPALGVRYYPLGSVSRRFDPYLGLGAAWAFGSASSNASPGEATYSGPALVPRLGLVAHVSSSFLLGGWIGRTISFWDVGCEGGGGGGDCLTQQGLSATSESDFFFFGLEAGARL